jgi:hypothetical protein
LEENVAAPGKKTKNTVVGIRQTDHVTPSTGKKLSLTSPTSGGCSVSIVWSWSQATEGVSCAVIKNSLLKFSHFANIYYKTTYSSSSIVMFYNHHVDINSIKYKHTKGATTYKKGLTVSRLTIAKILYFMQKSLRVDTNTYISP